MLASALPYAAAQADAPAAAHLGNRVRPGEPGWPAPQDWDALNRSVGGRLTRPVSPFADCGPAAMACRDAVRHIANPYFIGDQVALTQTSGWVDAWASVPSAYAVTAKSAADVAAAVNFARQHNLRLVIKGGGHSYQGTSDAPDSLLVWTRQMKDVALHEAFVARDCDDPAQPAVSLGAGALWMDAYDAVTTRGGRYVQGGGCTTVGVAGLVQSGGFNSFSKKYGTAAASLIEAEIVTADGVTRIANGRLHPDLFWAIKGGGGGSLGVVTRVTLRTRELPEFFGAVVGVIKAASDQAYRALIAELMRFYRAQLFNPHWGEHITLNGNTVDLTMLCQGLSKSQAEEIWAPFFHWVGARPEYSFVKPGEVLSFPAQHFWDGQYQQQHNPGVLAADDRPGAPSQRVLFADDRQEVGWFIHGYQSAWLPASLLEESRRPLLVDALFDCTRHWPVQLFFSKGLAGAPPGEIAAARDTATNPQMLDAFALAICAGSGPPAFAGMPGAASDLMVARDHAASIRQAMQALLKAAPRSGSYVAESDYFLSDWQSAFWGSNYLRLAAVKRKYDPDGLFFVHHGVGSEAWSADGFTRTEG